MTKPLPALLVDTTAFAAREDIDRIVAVPLRQRVRANSVYELVLDAARRWPEATAIRFLARGLASDEAIDRTFAEVAEQVTRTANLLAKLGVGRGDGVAILLPTMPEAFVALWGASTAGVACPINPLLSPAHIVEIMRAARVKVVVSVGPRIDAELFNGVRQAAEIVGATLAIVAGGSSPGTVDLVAERANVPGDRLSFDPPNLNDVASIFHTGGTTARPKLVAHTQLNQLTCAIQTATGSDLRPSDTLLSALPTNHVIAGIATGLAVLVTGARLLVPGQLGFRNPFLLQDFWKIVAAHDVVSFSAVPTVLLALMGVPVNAELRHLRYVSCGASPMPGHLIAAFEVKTGAKVIESYGMTEATTMVATNLRAGFRPSGSVGLPVPYLDLRIVSKASGGAEPCPPGMEGEIEIRGPAVVSGYFGEPPLIDADGWFATGDLGRLDVNGFLYLTGRAKDLIIRSGHNIDPRLIEEALHSHPAVAIAAAVGRPDAYAGEVPIAFVTLREGSHVTPDQLHAHAREHVSERPAAPAEVVILPTMPLTALGKIFKPALRAAARARVLQAELEPIARSAGARVVVRAASDTQQATVIAVSEPTEGDRPALAAAVEQRAAVLNVPIHIEWTSRQLPNFGIAS